MIGYHRLYRYQHSYQHWRYVRQFLDSIELRLALPVCMQLRNEKTFPCTDAALTLLNKGRIEDNFRFPKPAYSNAK